MADVCLRLPLIESCPSSYCPITNLLAGPQPIFLAVFEHDGCPKELRPRSPNLLRGRHFSVREMVANLDKKSVKNGLPGRPGFSHGFNDLVEKP